MTRTFEVPIVLEIGPHFAHGQEWHITLCNLFADSIGISGLLHTRVRLTDDHTTPPIGDYTPYIGYIARHRDGDLFFNREYAALYLPELAAAYSVYHGRVHRPRDYWELPVLAQAQLMDVYEAVLDDEFNIVVPAFAEPNLDHIDFAEFFEPSA